MVIVNEDGKSKKNENSNSGCLSLDLNEMRIHS